MFPQIRFQRRNEKHFFKLRFNGKTHWEHFCVVNKLHFTLVASSIGNYFFLHLRQFFTDLNLFFLSTMITMRVKCFHTFTYQHFLFFLQNTCNFCNIVSGFSRQIINQGNIGEILIFLYCLHQFLDQFFKFNTSSNVRTTPIFSHLVMH